MSKPIDKIFDDLPDSFEVTPFVNERAAGFDIAFSMKSFGFGHLTYGFSRKHGVLFADTEMMSEATLTKIIQASASDLAKKLIALDEQYAPFQQKEMEEYDRP